MLCRRGAVRDVRHDDHEVADEPLGGEPRHDGRALRERLHERSDECVTGIERRERDGFPGPPRDGGGSLVEAVGADTVAAVGAGGGRQANTM